MGTHLEQIFPKLTPDVYQITSPASRNCNCVAWAAGYDDIAWCPWNVPYTYWPHGVSRDGSVDSLVAAYETEGFVECNDASMERGFEKIAIYGDPEDQFQHAARQLPDGQWSSKLGGLEDICHKTLADVECEDYGKAVRFVKRPLQKHDKS